MHKIKLRTHTCQAEDTMKHKSKQQIRNVRIQWCNSRLACQSYLTQGCTILLDDKTMAIEEFIK